MTFQEWLKNEASNYDVIAVKRIYIDVAGDFMAGILLSQIIYWFLPGKTGPKTTIQKDGRFWLAKRRDDWWEECRIHPKQFDRCISILEGLGFVKTDVFKFNGNPIKHISLVGENLLKAVEFQLNTRFEENGSSHCGNELFPVREDHILQTTSQTTSEVQPKGKTTLKSKVTPIIEEIYDSYPRRIGKPAALKSIVRVLSCGKISDVALLEKTKLYAQLRGTEDMAFIPYPATWFNQHRFDDDPSTWKRAINAPKPLSPAQEAFRLNELKEKLRELQEAFRYAHADNQPAIREKIKAVKAQLPQE